MSMSRERRRHPRVRFSAPIRGAVGPARIYVLDASPNGVGIAHQAAIPAPGSFCRVEMPSELGPIKLDCTIVRTVAQSANAAAKKLFHSGLEVVAADRQSAERLRTLTEAVPEPAKK